MSFDALVDCESQKIFFGKTFIHDGDRTVILYDFFDTCQLNVSGENANIHMRSDTKNKETTARTIHLPEQKEPSV